MVVGLFLVKYESFILHFMKLTQSEVNLSDQGFPGGSDGKESACNVGDLGSISWEDPLEKEMATHSNISAGEFHGQRSLAGYSPWDRKELDMTAWLLLSLSH